MRTETKCPLCGETRLIDWDPVLQRWVCAVCARTWQRSVEGEARRLAQIRVSRWPEMLLR